MFEISDNSSANLIALVRSSLSELVSDKNILKSIKILILRYDQETLTMCDRLVHKIKEIIIRKYIILIYFYEKYVSIGSPMLFSIL